MHTRCGDALLFLLRTLLRWDIADTEEQSTSLPDRGYATREICRREVDRLPYGPICYRALWEDDPRNAVELLPNIMRLGRGMDIADLGAILEQLLLKGSDAIREELLIRASGLEDEDRELFAVALEDRGHVPVFPQGYICWSRETTGVGERGLVEPQAIGTSCTPLRDFASVERLERLVFMRRLGSCGNTMPRVQRFLRKAMQRSGEEGQ
jgi:hypothetical protein